MTKNYTIQILDEVSIVRFTEPPSYSDIINTLNEFSDNEQPLRLWDLTSGMNLTTNELISIADHGKKTLKKAAKVAIVAPSDLTFGLSRMHGVYREQDSLDANVFRSKEEAINWLKS